MNIIISDESDDRAVTKLHVVLLNSVEAIEVNFPATWDTESGPVLRAISGSTFAQLLANGIIHRIGATNIVSIAKLRNRSRMSLKKKRKKKGEELKKKSLKKCCFRAMTKKRRQALQLSVQGRYFPPTNFFLTILSLSKLTEGKTGNTNRGHMKIRSGERRLSLASMQA
jgi:hypothetical protein